MTRRVGNNGPFNEVKDFNNYKIAYKMFYEGKTLDEVVKKLRIGKEKIREILSLYGNTTVAGIKDKAFKDLAQEKGAVVLNYIEEGIGREVIQNILGVTERELLLILIEEGYESYTEAREELFYFRQGYFLLPELLKFNTIIDFCRHYNIDKSVVDKMAKVMGYKNAMDYKLKNKGE